MREAPTRPARYLLRRPPWSWPCLALFLPVMAHPVPSSWSLIALLLLRCRGARPTRCCPRAFARGVSQNVVAKYEPGYTAEAGGSRRRKVIRRGPLRQRQGALRAEAARSCRRCRCFAGLNARRDGGPVPLLLDPTGDVVFLHADRHHRDRAQRAGMAIVLVFVALPVLEVGTAAQVRRLQRRPRTATPRASPCCSTWRAGWAAEG